MQLAKKHGYKLNLVDLHTLCEANYIRLHRLFPAYETTNAREFMVGSARVLIEVTERCRYTTMFKVVQSGANSQWLGHLTMEIRAYHDAKMAEIGMFQSHRRIDGRYQYPNDKMYQQDEKTQQNRFLADWLQHCIEHGQASSLSLPTCNKNT